MKELLAQALCGQTVSISDEQLTQAFVRSFDGEPSFCCVADLRSWCATYALQLTASPSPDLTQTIYTISKPIA